MVALWIPVSLAIWVCLNPAATISEISSFGVFISISVANETYCISYQQNMQSQFFYRKMLTRLMGATIVQSLNNAAQVRQTMQPTDFTPYIVTFADTEVRVEARDCDEAQELAIEKVEGRQGFTTEIVRIVRARAA